MYTFSALYFSVHTCNIHSPPILSMHLLEITSRNIKRKHVLCRAIRNLHHVCRYLKQPFTSSDKIDMISMHRSIIVTTLSSKVLKPIRK